MQFIGISMISRAANVYLRIYHRPAGCVFSRGGLAFGINDQEATHLLWTYNSAMNFVFNVGSVKI